MGSGRLDEGVLLPQAEEVEISEKNHELRAMATANRARLALLTREPRPGEGEEACQAEDPPAQLPKSALYLQVGIAGTGFPGLLITTGRLFCECLNYDNKPALTIVFFYFTYRFVSEDLIQRKDSWLKNIVNLISFSHTVGETAEPKVSPLHRPQGLMIESPFLSRLPSSSISGEGVVMNMFVASCPSLCSCPLAQTTIRPQPQT